MSIFFLVIYKILLKKLVDRLFDRNEDILRLLLGLIVLKK
jgi:hypothetical protein